MNIKRKLMIQFSYQLIIVFLILYVVTMIFLVIIANTAENHRLESSFTNIEEDEYSLEDFLLGLVLVDKEKIEVRQQAEDTVLRQNGWLQILDEQGQQVYALNIPDTLPQAYAQADIVSLTQNRQGHTLEYWMFTHFDRDYIVLYGVHQNDEHERLLKAVQEEDRSIIETETLSDGMKQELVQQEGTLYVLDENHQLIIQYPDHAGRQSPYSTAQIVDMQKRPWNYEEKLLIHHESEHLFVLEFPNEHYYPEQFWHPQELRIMGLTFLTLFTVLLVVAFWYAHKFGKPILHMMQWVKQISAGVYHEPVNRKGQPVSKNSAGKTKKSYHVFKDILSALDQLTKKLKQDQHNLEQMDQRREGWISGLSHDLKTPLSSLYGYSVLLESDQHQWTPQDVQKFGKVMKEKAEYMSALIDDLNLSYRLKNNALPLAKQKVDINQFVRHTVEQFKLHPGIQKEIIEVHTESETIMYDIDKKYFKRVLDNLLANAVKHNPQGVKINVTVNKQSTGFSISIADNGIGMEEDTVQQLFERYYRGETTHADTNGTGLGLAISKQLVLAHGGRININSTVGKGTTVTLFFEETAEG